MQSYNPAILASGVHFLKIIEWSLSTKTRKMLANHVYAHLLLFLQPSVLWFSTFNNYVKPPGAKVNFARIWSITNLIPTSLGYLTLKRWHGKIWPQLRGLPSVTDRLPTFKGHPTDHVNVIKLKWEIIWTGGLPQPGTFFHCVCGLYRAFSLIYPLRVHLQTPYPS